MPRTARNTRPVNQAIEDEIMAKELPADPEPAKRGRGRPRGSTTSRASAGTSAGTAALKKQVHTELYAFASMFAGIWEMRDPECAAVLNEKINRPDGSQARRLEEIITQTVDILARSDKVLAVLANAGLTGQLVMLGSLVMPVAKQVWKAHGPNGTGHGESEPVYDTRNYPAPALAS